MGQRTLPWLTLTFSAASATRVGIVLYANKYIKAVYRIGSHQNEESIERERKTTAPSQPFLAKRKFTLTQVH